jgi:uncharacterized protein YndB with AHSA1/START domain
MKTMSATIQVGAPPMTVWAILTDLKRYPDWNPLFREASGQIAVGNRITLRTLHPAGALPRHRCRGMGGGWGRQRLPG